MTRSIRARLLGLGTATPPHMPQAVSATFAEARCCESDEQRQFLHRIYSHCGVHHRGSVLIDASDRAYSRSHAFYPPRTSAADRGPTTSQRMTLYAQYAPELAATAAIAAIADAHLAPDQITHLLPVTCTGFFAPGLDVELIGRLGLPASVQRVQVGFMGCHGAFNALAVARSIAMADRNARILVCCVELCSLHLAYGFDPQRQIANSLFADGAAATIVAASDLPAPALLASATQLIPDSPDAMTWRIGDHGFEMTLSAQVPSLIGRHVRPWVESMLAKEQMTLDQIAHLAIHPGGPKVLTATLGALGRSSHQADASRAVLADHGNMSSATILFVLQRLLADGATGRCLGLGFGPGLTAEAMLLELP